MATKLEEKLEGSAHEAEDSKLKLKCDPAMLAEAQQKLSNPHSASTLPDAGGKNPDDPCTKLAKRLTPAIAYGHVVIKEPDGNVSQVPNEENAEQTIIERVKNNGILYNSLMSAFYLAVFCTLC